MALNRYRDLRRHNVTALGYMLCATTDINFKMTSHHQGRTAIVDATPFYFIY
jgi:hypothetical protein